MEKALTTAVAVVQNRIGRVAHTHTNTHTKVYFIMMDGYDCTQCACVCVCIRVSVEVSLRCTCSHLAGLGSCRRVGPPSLIVSCTRISTFACANLSNNMWQPTMVPNSHLGHLQRSTSIHLGISVAAAGTGPAGSLQLLFLL